MSALSQISVLQPEAITCPLELISSTATHPVAWSRVSGPAMLATLRVPAPHPAWSRAWHIPALEAQGGVVKAAPWIYSQTLAELPALQVPLSSHRPTGRWEALNPTHAACRGLGEPSTLIRPPSDLLSAPHPPPRHVQSVALRRVQPSFSTASGSQHSSEDCIVLPQCYWMKGMR